MKTDIEIFNEHVKDINWNDYQLIQTSALMAMKEYAKQEMINFKKYYDKLTPSDKCTVWSESGDASGLFTMSDKAIVEKYLEKRKIKLDVQTRA